jgi:hypothetical protein
VPARLSHEELCGRAREGLSHTERQLLAAVERGVTSRMQPLVETTAPDERPYLGDSVFSSPWSGSPAVVCRC